MRTKFGVQPAREILRSQRWSIAKAADQIGVPELHLHGVLYGRTAPSRPVRERLPILLAADLADLFTVSALAVEYDPRRGPGGKQGSKKSWLKAASK